VDSTTTSCDDINSDVQYLLIVNQKLEGGNNYLHVLVSQMAEENEAEISEMIRVLLVNGCNPNTQNDKGETPFYLLLKNLRKSKFQKDLIKLFSNHPNVDLHSHNEIIGLMEQKSVSDKIIFAKPVKDVNFMVKLIEQWNELKFIQEFEGFINFHGDVAKLLDEAIVRNLWKIVEVIVKNGIDGNRRSNVYKLSPAFLACKFGHHEVLKVLLSDPKLRFRNENQNLLHQLLETENIHESDRQKCFNLIVADRRCTYDVINGFDLKHQPALFYASHYGFHDIAKSLLRHGAFIGHESVINNIEKDVLREFLDENITCSGNVKDKNCEIHVDYRFLMDEKSDKEIKPVNLITQNSKLQELVLHPVILSFLDFKWKKIDFIVYFNLFVYFCFMIFLGCFVINYFHDSTYNNFGSYNNSIDGDEYGGIFKTKIDGRRSGEDDSNTVKAADSEPRSPGFASGASSSSNGLPFDVSKVPEMQPTPPPSPLNFKKPNLISLLFGRSNSDDQRTKRSTETEMYKIWERKFVSHFNDNVISYRICVFGVLLMAIYEVLQFATSYKQYFLKFSNWLDISMIGLSYVVLLGSFDFEPEDFKKIRALMILIMAAQTIQLVAKVSFLSMSLHMAIFNSVFKTFLKTIALYMIMILAFAMSFYTLNDTSKEKGVNFKSDSDETFSDPFISIITIVRMMLSDFENIKIDAKDHFQGFMFLLFVILITVVLFNLLNALAISDTQNIIKDAELVETKKRISILNSYEKLFNYLNVTFANIFPEMSKIVITPNKDRTVKVKQTFLKSHTISIHKTSKSQNLVSLVAKNKFFWKTEQNWVKLDRKVIEKMQNILKDKI
jgi:hypothetical protein